MTTIIEYIARSRAVRWRTGETFQNGAYGNRHSCEDPKRNDGDDDDDGATLINKDTNSLSLIHI